MTEFKELSLASIEVGDDRARPLDPLAVEALAALIREQGLLQRIVVREVDDAHHLVAGWHRLEAVRSLGLTTIRAEILTCSSDDDAKLAEVMENLGRKELIAFDRCRHLYDLKQVWERKYPHTKNGGDPAAKAEAARNRKPDSGTDAPEVFGFVRACAEKIGLGRTQISEAVSIWTGLTPQTRERIREELHGTKLADNQGGLKSLSKLSPVKQEKVLDAITDPALPDIDNVASAQDFLSEGVVCDPLEKRFMTITRSIAGLDDETFDSVIAAHEDRVIASLTRRGRI